MNVESHGLQSKIMRRHVRWGLAMPTGKVDAAIMCLHGRDGSHAFTFDEIGVHDFVAADKLPWAVVSIDGGSNSYWHPRADDTDAQAMTFQELLPTVRERLGPLPLLLLGWSMGGYGALLAASDHREEVTAVATASPAIWRSLSQSPAGAFDDAADFHRHDLFRRVASLRDLPVWIGCGDDDVFVDVASALADELARAEKMFGPGSHDVELWRSYVPTQLAFFRRSIGQVPGRQEGDAVK